MILDMPAARKSRIRGAAGFVKPFFIPAAIAAAVVFTGGYLIEQQNKQAFRKELHTGVANELNLVATRLRGEINANIAAIRSFASAIAAAPDMPQRVFDEQAASLLQQNPQILRLSTAPDAVITMSFPHRGNERMIGTDFKKFRSSRVAIDLARNQVRPVIAGPVRLPSGKSGFTLFFPVFVKKNGVSAYWGFIEGVIDEWALYRDAEVFESGALTGQHSHVPITLAMRDISVKDNVMEPFLGDASTFLRGPVVRELAFPGGTWELAAIPQGGWNKEPENTLKLRLMILAAGLMIIIPIISTGRLVSERQRNAAKLRDRELQLSTLSRRLDLALDASKIGVWEIDARTNVHTWDERMNSLHGLLPDQQTRSYPEWRGTLHEDDIATASRTLIRTINEGLEYRSQYRVRHPDGKIRHIRSVGSASDGSSGALITGISWDVTEDVLMTEQIRTAKASADAKNAELEDVMRGLFQREQELEATTRRLNLALDSYQCGMWEADLEKGTAFWDERMHQLYGLVYTDGKAYHETWLNTLHPDDRQDALDAVNRTIEGKSNYVQQSRVVLPGGSIRHVRSVAKLQVLPDGSRKLIGIAFDISADVAKTEQLQAAKAFADAKNRELEQAKNSIEYNALHDPLTELGNRRKLDRELERLSTGKTGRPRKVGVLHIDLDRFKQINDTLGHAAGDAMLIHASRILRSSVGPSDFVARIGGDEFVVVVSNAADSAYLTNLAERIIDEMRQPVDYNGFPCRFGVSIGIAAGSGKALDARKLLINADIALYKAKERGRNRHEFFTEALQAEIITTKRIADEIMEGIERDEFTAWYQPQIAAGTLELEGLEALVRWNHPQQGLLLPGSFLKVAEEMNIMAMLDRIVLERALKDSLKWAAAGIRVPKISVNVSARRLRDESLVNSLKDLSFSPGQIAFELVESIFLDESDDIVTHNIEEIKKLGIDIEIDDFGTGHTSIVSLLKIKPKRLKIDRQLVSPIIASKHERALVRSIIDIARSLNIEVVAEGVETLQHAELLSALGCNLLQGFAFARPLPADEIISYATRPAHRKAS